MHQCVPDGPLGITVPFGRCAGVVRSDGGQPTSAVASAGVGTHSVPPDVPDPRHEGALGTGPASLPTTPGKPPSLRQRQLSVRVERYPVTGRVQQRHVPVLIGAGEAGDEVPCVRQAVPGRKLPGCSS